MKRESIIKTAGPAAEEQFEFSIEEIMFPFGFFMINKIEGGQDRITRHYFKDMNSNIGRDLALLPIF